jgi:hypothetical protein
MVLRLKSGAGKYCFKVEEKPIEQKEIKKIMVRIIIKQYLF